MFLCDGQDSNIRKDYADCFVSGSLISEAQETLCSLKQYCIVPGQQPCSAAVRTFTRFPLLLPHTHAHQFWYGYAPFDSDTSTYLEKKAYMVHFSSSNLIFMDFSKVNHARRSEKDIESRNLNIPNIGRKLFHLTSQISAWMERRP